MNISPNRKTLLLRVLGALIAVIGGLLFWLGGKEISLDLYGGAALSIPLEYFLIVLGLTLLCLPLVIVYTLALVLPGKFEAKLEKFADSLDPEYQKLKEDPNPQSVATILHRHIHRANKRSNTLIFIGIIFIFVLLPLLVTNMVSTSQAKRESERLVSLVQETRVDFASSDHFRERLHEAEGGLSSKSAATRNIYEVLQILYDPSIKNPADFDRTIDSVYESRIKPYVTEGGLLRIDSFKLRKSSSDAKLAPATYLTLLATVCNSVGDNGKHVDPYLQGRQLLRLAFDYLHENDKVPATHNMAGVNFAGLLKAYGSLGEKFRAPQLAPKIQAALDVNDIPSQLSLLRNAKAEYIAAEQQSPTNLAKARSLNNQVDALLTFLYRIHVEDQLDPQIIRDDTDRRFLQDELAIKLPDRTIDGQKLVEILARFKTNLNEALKLSQEPEIFFTRAQLFSIGGALGEKYKLSGWVASDDIGNLAVSDLRTAASMQMPLRLFERSEAKQFYLEWLWTRPKLVAQLQQLSRSENRS